MKVWKKIGTILLAGLFCTCALTSCVAGKNTSSTEDGGVATVAQSDTHYANNTRRSDYIVKDGQAQYTLVIPTEAKEHETLAADLIVEYYEKATGAKLNVITDNRAQANGRYVSLGDTTLFRQSGIAVPESKYGSSGFRIVTKGDTVYISGARNTMREGTYYGAQEFLKHTISWRAYTPSEVYYNETSSVFMYDFDVVEIPDFDYRAHSTSEVYYAGKEEYARYLRVADRNAQSDKNETVDGLSGHSHFSVLHPADYYDEHPEWYYSTVGAYSAANHEEFWLKAQLCLTNEEMIAEFIECVTQLFINDATANFIHLGQMDSSAFCDCTSCKQWMIDHNNTTNAGMLVWFTNRVARGVTENIKRIAPNRNLTFEMFAYLATVEPPMHEETDESGNTVYVVDHPDVVPDKNVIVQFTPLLAVNSQTIDHQTNATYYKYLKAWSQIAELSTWMYGYSDHHQIIRYKGWDVFTHDLRLFKELGVTRMYYQGCFMKEATDIEEMRLWIVSRLMWDTRLNWQDLEKEFVSAYYGSVAGEAQEYFNYMTTYVEKLRENDGYYGTTYFSTSEEKYWSFAYVEGGRKILEKGYQKLQAIKDSQPDEYIKYYYRYMEIYLENLYMQMKFHLDRYSTEYCRETIARIRDALSTLGITEFTQYENAEGALQEWEVMLGD